ncbi:MAG: GNAT family N-acetyltransferase [Asticcacaulis sp.]|nr:GNAT family N-acetyltransferase [Asticcacaulis sp.]
MPEVDRIELLRPQDLTAEDEARWAGFVAASPDLTGPYFDVRYIRAIAGAVPNAGVARLYGGGRVVGYFAYQKRGPALLPMGAPLSDYHAVIAEPGFVLDFDDLLSAAGARRLEFQGLIGAAGEGARTLRLTRRLADATRGFDAWWKTQDGEHHKFFKNIGRCQRNVEKDFGGFAFTWERVTPEVMDWVIGLKRDQYKKTGMHDVFDCGWTRTLLDHLAAVEAEDFGLRAGVFRHEGRLVAAEISLFRGEDVHLWFPAYDCAFARYSVGILLTVAIIRHTEAQGLKRFDFGTGGEDYKSPLTTAGGDCLEGDIALAPGLLSRVGDAVEHMVPQPRLEAARLSLRRRVKVIRATETGLTGWGRAVLSLTQRAVMRLREHNPA